MVEFKTVQMAIWGRSRQQQQQQQNITAPARTIMGTGIEPL